MRPLVWLLVFAMAARAGAIGATKAVAAKGIPGLHVSGEFVSRGESRNPENIVKGFHLYFTNDTDYELASVTVRFRSTPPDGRPPYVGKPQTFRRFVNAFVAYTGSGLPHQTFDVRPPMLVDYPSRYWVAYATEGIEVVSAEVYLPKQDLNDKGHRLSWLATQPDRELMTSLEGNPTLFKGSTPADMVAGQAFGVASAPVLEAMLRLGAKPITPSLASKMTLMHLAAVNRHAGVCAVARKAGAPVDAENTAHSPPLDLAICKDNRDAFDWLLSHGAKATGHTGAGIKSVTFAIQRESNYYLDELHRAGVDFRSTIEGWNVLHYAAYFASPEKTEYFLKQGVPIDLADPNTGETPLMVAAQQQAFQVSIYLLKHGASWTLRDKKGEDLWSYVRQGNTLHTDQFFLKELRAAKLEVPANARPKVYQ